MSHPFRPFILIPALIALLAPSSPKLGDPTLGPVQKIKQWGYSIRPIDGWTSMPAEPGQRFIVGRWKGNMDEARKRGDFDGMMAAQAAEVSIVRIPLQSGTTSAPAAAAGEKTEKEKREEEFKKIRTALAGSLEKRENPKSVNDWIEGNYEGASKRYSKKEIKAGPLTGSLLEFTSGSEALCIAVFSKDEIEWAVVYVAFEESYRKTFEKIYKQSIQSFRLFEPEGKPDAILTSRDQSQMTGEDRRNAIKAGIAGNPGWYAIDTKNYVFLSNSGNKGFIQTLAREIEVLRSKVYEKMFPPQKEIDTISIVRILSTQSDYHQYGGPPGSAGYWNSKAEELVLFTEFDSQTKKNSKAYCKSVMYHEAFHQYIHYAVGDLAPHSWFNEGHGDYFAGASISGSNVRIQPFDWRVDFLRDHLRNKRDLLPLQSLVRLPQREYYTNGLLKYSQGWAFIYFLRNATKNKRYQEIPDIYFTHLSENIAAFKKQKEEKDGDDPLGGSIPGIPGIEIVKFEDIGKVDAILSEAVDRAFDGIDFEKLDKDFQAWVRSL